MKTLVLASVLLAGCRFEPIELDFTDSTIAATDDGTTLVIEGCPESGLFGCSTPYETASMSVTADGVTRPVPVIDGLILFPSHVFETQLPSPTQRVISIDMNGYRAQIDLLPVFNVEVEPVVVRTDAMTIRYYSFEDAVDSLALTSQCGSLQQFDVIPAPTKRGVVEYRLPTSFDGLGVCEHTLRIQQTISVPNTAGYSVTNTRTQNAWFTSYP